MDAAVVAAIIGAGSAIAVAIVTAFLGLRSYRYQKQVDRREYSEQKAVDREEELRKDRGKAYAAYLSANAEMERWRGIAGKEQEFAEALVEYSKNYSALFNVAKDEVLRPAAAFHEFALVQNNSDWEYDKWVAEWKDRYATMLLAMRKDAFVQQTAMSEGELAERLPWYFDWDINAKSQEEVPTAT
jgi:hypothetical protein